MSTSSGVKRHSTRLDGSRVVCSRAAAKKAFAVAALVSLVFHQPLSAMSRPTAQHVESWTFSRDHFGRAPVCIVSGHGRPYVDVQFLVSAKRYGEVGVTAGSENWSIKDGDFVGDIAYVSSSAELTGTPTAVAQGFFFSADPREVLTFARATKDGFEVKRNGETIARFPSGNLARQIDKLIACAAELHAADPFAQPVDAPSR